MTRSDRQSQQDASAATMPEGDREFWERAFCAVLGVEISGSIDEDVDYARRAADAALAARNSRIWPGREG